MNKPDISIVVPTHNRQRQVASCISSLAKQELNERSLEIIIVDDGSTPVIQAESLSEGKEIDLKIIYQKNAGPARARNAGAKIAHGNYLLFIDDDCQPEPNWARIMMRELATSENTVVGGMTVNGLPQNIFAAASQLLNTYLYSYYNENGSSPKFFASNNMGFRKSDFLTIGGFSTKNIGYYSEDRDICDKWTSSGGKMKYLSQALVSHSHHMNLKGFWMQHFRYGNGARMLHLEMQERGKSRPSIEPLSFYLSMLAMPFREKAFIEALFSSLLIFLSQVAHTLGYFWQRFGLT